MKPIAIICMLLVAVSAGAGEWNQNPPMEGEWFANPSQMADIQSMEVTSVIFGNDHTGELSWKDGVFRFTGNADASAQVFLDWLQQHYENRAQMYCQPKNAEIVKVLERVRPYIGGWQLQTMTLESCDELCLAERRVVEIQKRRQLEEDIDELLKRLK